MPADLRALRADGERVWVRTVHADDVPGYRVAVEQSRARLEQWNPTDDGELAASLASQSRDRRTFVIHARDVRGGHDIVGRVNVVNVVRGRFLSAAMGYDAYDPYAGRGLFTEGLRLVVGLVLADEQGVPPGMGLHRLEASVQPGNIRSATVLRSLGFRQEGRSPRMLWLSEGTGPARWREHVRFAVTREEWPARPYADRRHLRRVVLVNGVPGSRRRPLAADLARELAVPMVAASLPQQAVWRVLADSPVGGVVEGWFGAGDAGSVRDGLAAASLDPAAVPEVWCDLPVSVARNRSAGRAAGAAFWESLPLRPAPLGMGPQHRVDTSGDLTRGTVVRLALAFDAASA